MFFSIIVPVYNAAPYIERCLQSVFEQNIGENKLEVIVINDGSTDNSEQIASELSKGRRDVIILTQKNKGLGGARNTGIENASGEYIIFLDADDYLDENCLTLLDKRINDKRFSEIDVFELSCNFVSEKNKIITIFIPQFTGEIYDGIEYYLKAKSINSACNKIYKRSSLENLRFKEKIYSEDSDFNSRAFFFFKKVCALDIVIANFVQTTGSITRSKNKDTQRKYLQDTITVSRSFQDFEKIHSAHSLEEKKYFDKKYTLFTVTIFYLLYKYNMKTSEALKIKSELEKDNLFILTYKHLERKRNLFRILLKYFLPVYIFILGLRNRIN